MSKLKFTGILFIAIVLILTVAITPGCKATTAEATSAPETVIVKETVVETVIKEVEKVSPYTFDKLREMANARKYEDTPAKGIKVAFQNLGDVDFTVAVEKSIVDEWALAGGNKEDLTILSADFDTAKAAQNHDVIFGMKPDVWVQFWYDGKQNDLVGLRAQQEGIPIIAIDIPVLGATFMGANNYLAGRMIGEFIIEYAEKNWGGWDNVDMVTTPDAPFAGAVVNQRILGPLDVLFEKYGESAAYEIGKGQLEGSKIVLMPMSGATTAEVSSEVIRNILSAYPDAKKIVNISINAQGVAGVQAGADTLGRWNADDWLMVTNGGEQQGNQLMRDGLLDGDVAYFPENYGQYIIPAIIAIKMGNPVPPDILVDHIMLTPDNLDQYYPAS